MLGLARVTASRALLRRGEAAAAAALRGHVVGRQAAAAAAIVASQQQRCFAGAAGKVAKVLEAELKHEEAELQPNKSVKDFLAKSDFKFVDTEGDVNMMLERQAGDKIVRIEWQARSPFDAEMGEEGEAPPDEGTDFSVTVESKSKGSGIIFYCFTEAGEDSRYIIGNVKAFKSTEEKESVSGYNGPEFDDVDEKLQEAFDEYLAEVGVSNQVCDFIDESSLDKEQREYIRWLRISKDFLES